MDSHKCYHLLGLPDGATMQEVKAAYRRLALRYHPDKNTSKQYEEKFKMVAEAYQTLRMGGDHVTKSTPVDQKHTEDNISSKIPYWNEIFPETILKEWSRYVKYAGKTYREICKYEQGLWRYYEKMTNCATSTLFPSISTQYNRVPVFLTANVYKPLLKTSSKNIKSKLRL